MLYDLVAIMRQDIFIEVRNCITDELYVSGRRGGY